MPQGFREEAFTCFYEIAQTEVVDAKRALGGTQEDVREASHAMESRYDTFREEAEYLAAGQAQKVIQKRGIVGVLDKIREDCLRVREDIQSGALVTLEEIETGNVSIFFVIPGGAGKKINLSDGREVVCIAPNTPLGRRLIQKEIGDEIKLVSNSVSKVFEIQRIE